MTSFKFLKVFSSSFELFKDHTPFQNKKRSYKLLIRFSYLVLFLFFLFSGSAWAAQDSAYPKFITPDDLFYNVVLALENAQLDLTTDPEERSGILSVSAQRLSASNQADSLAEKIDLSQSLTPDDLNYDAIWAIENTQLTLAGDIEEKFEIMGASIGRLLSLLENDGKPENLVILAQDLEERSKELWTLWESLDDSGVALAAGFILKFSEDNESNLEKMIASGKLPEKAADNMKHALNNQEKAMEKQEEALARAQEAKARSEAAKAQAALNRQKEAAEAAAASTPGLSGTTPGLSGTTPGQSGTTPGKPDTTPGQPGTTPGNSGSTPGQPGTTPGNSGSTPGQPGTTPGNSGSTPGQSGTTPGNSGSTPGQSGATPGNSGSAPGQSKR